MFYNNINPVLLRLGSLEIRYYGIIFALGFAAAYFFIVYLAKQMKPDLKKDDILELIFYLIIGSVLGARVFEIVFYNLRYYLENPLEMIAVWHGGLSFHGGLIGGGIAGWIYCEKKGISFYEMADICVIPFAFALFLGRIANFINGELVGRITNLPWCVKFKDYGGCRHPSQIYESLKNLFIFFALWLMKDKRLKKGLLFWSFVVMYSFIRFFIEFVKEPGAEGFILGLTMGQWLSLIMFSVGACFFVRGFARGYKGSIV